MRAGFEPKAKNRCKCTFIYVLNICASIVHQIQCFAFSILNHAQNFVY